MTTQLGTTITQALAQGVDELKQLPDAQLDVQWLLLKILEKKEVSWLIAHGENQLTDHEFKSFLQLVTRRSKGEPLAYILGEWEFFGRPFIVNESVLVPRPSTEQLVREALEYLKKALAQKQAQRDKVTAVVADIGTGSGCVAITLGLEIEKWKKTEGIHVDWQIIATDISAAALEVARRNAERWQVADRIEFVKGDLLLPIRDRQVDLIVSNPPYVPVDDLAGDQGNSDKIGLRYEPRVALDGGRDGLVLVNQLLKTEKPLIYETISGVIRNKNLSV